MQDSGKKALKSGVWYTVGNFILKGMGFLTTPIFTRVLTTEEVGAFANYNSWLSILAIITTFDLYSAINTAKFDFKEKLDDFIVANLVLGSTITISFYFIIILFKSFFLNLFGFSELELNVAFLYFLVYPAMQMFQIRSRIMYKYKVSVALSIVSGVASTGISLICVLVLENNKYIGRYLGYTLPIIVINIAIYFYLICLAKKENIKEWIAYWKYALTISFPMIWHLLANSLLNSSDKVMINNICGSYYTALYSVAYSCAFVVHILWTSMNNAWSPWAYEQMNEGNLIVLRNASKKYIIGFALMVLCFLLVAPEILWLMGGKRYLTAVMIIPPVMISYVFQFVYSLYVNVEIFSKKQKWIAMGTIIASLINVILNYIFIPEFGYIAAAFTTLVGYIVLFFIHYFLVKKMGKESWYDTKFNFIFLFISIIEMFIFIFLYNYLVLRYIIIGIIFILLLFIVVKKRKNIKEIFKTKSLKSLLNI